MHARLIARLSIASLSVLAATMLAPSQLGAHHKWGNYHWPRASNPLLLDIGDNVDNSWGSAYAGAITDWDQSNVLQLSGIGGGSDAETCPPTEGRVEVCNANSGDTGWLGLAQIWISSKGHITQGVTRLNDFYFDPNYAGGFYNTSAWRRLVMCQEIGHTFGLDHQDETFDNPNLGTCMDYTSDPDGPPSNEHPNLHDYDQLESIYSHLDGASSGGGGGGGRHGGGPPNIVPMPPQAAGRAGGDSPRQWGALVRSNGRLALYDLDLGNGEHLFTFVIRP